MKKKEIKYAQKNGIPVPASKKFPYSVDDNMWGMTWEGGEIEEPDVISPVEKFLKTHSQDFFKGRLVFLSRSGVRVR
jgi:argininosuccinate synthase